VKKIGYFYLIEKLELLVPPLSVHYYQGDKSEDEEKDLGQYKVKILAKRKATGATIFDHISTAIKYEGIRLAYLYPIFEVINETELAEYIKEQPNNNTRRAIWYLFEWLMNKKLDVPNSSARYMALLDDEYYFTRDINNGVKDRRTRVINNCIGNKHFCPMVRKTKELEKWSKVDLIQIKKKKLEKLSEHLNTEVLGRSISYLYTKETKSSTEIEKEDSSISKTQKFFRVLKSSGTMNLSKQRLLFIQNQIVNDSAKKDRDYRDKEIYVGETRLTKHGPDEDIHYIGPTHSDVSNLMKGLLQMHEQLMLDNTLPSMIHAAILSFGLVYIHPFSDGNGRLHRYLIHDVLKARSPKEDDLIIPVSAAILNNTKQYDAVLEKISDPIMAMLDYELQEDNSVVINNHLPHLYRYPDYTEHVIFLYDMMSSSLNIDLVEEIIFILKFDKIKKAINDKYDIENKDLDLLTSLLLQNDGVPSKKVAKKYCDILSAKDLKYIEAIAKTTIIFFDRFLQEDSTGDLDEKTA